ncbi:DNA gyrase subunit A [Brumimicrobium glaciale]|uniref:DNA gyrase subunit A n=1 Tax=Brumimicrobium glaciale TaxID=200475 RepID=A0A4Q4KGH1_9FLAO|nr:DNA gyrase subunit A [Brumimicrobium glaciale]RYM30799.1 DNA gyrase subunit A [Brumimicrobium glaciale]
MAEGERIIKINIEDEMKSAYIDYSMSVIVSRALPDVRDGFKPVHRRVLYGMQDLGVYSNKAHKKSARIVGEVLGKYHPHGDSSVYDTMVRMAQYWSLRYPLVDGQGNFGSMDGDSPAAMRYTEARLRKISEEMLGDLDKETVDFVPNFDDSLTEPTVLPTKVPNLLINGASGIAVGMATNMAPHNLTEVINGTIAYVDDKDIDIEGLMKYITAPDFPTGGIIYGYDGVKSAFETGKGRIVIRAKAIIEENKHGREHIVVSEVPYQVNKADMIKKTADMVNEGRIEGITDIRDESDRNGLRIVYELKRDAIPNVVLNKLFKFTALQTSFSVNNICLVDGRPELLNLKQMIEKFVAFRHEVIVRRTKYELRKAEERAHLLEGLIIASDNIDEVIKIIRASNSPDEARENLIKRFELSDLQSRAIVEMRLRQLTGLEQDKLRAEYAELMITITDLKDILANESRRMAIIREELEYIREKYGDERRSIIEYSASEMRIEDLIPDDEVVVTISHAGYIKRTSLSEYKVQNRGGTGSKGSTTRDKDFLETIFVATNHNYLMVFTEKGKCFWMRVFEVPEGSKTSKGRAIQNLINIEQDDKIKAYINVEDLTNEEYVDNNFIIMCTKKGIIKKTKLEAYSRPRSNGINAININEGDELLSAKLTNGKQEIILAKRSGYAIRFNESTVRTVGRNSIGVKGVKMSRPENDEVIGMICLEPDSENSILVVSENGYGKRSFFNDPETGDPIYRVTNRGGKGVKTLSVTEKTGDLIAILNVTDDDDLMIITKRGITIRSRVDQIRVMGRAAQGVKVINLSKGGEIAAVAKVPKEDDVEIIEGEIVDGEIVEGGVVDSEDIDTENPDAPEEDGTENDTTEE